MAARGRFYADLLERSAWTFVQAFLAAFFVDGFASVGLDLGDKFKIAAAAGGIAVAKCLLATQVGAENTAATLPSQQDTPTPNDGSAPFDGESGNSELRLFFIVVAAVLVALLIASLI